jgi:hypothetical protein
VLLPHEIDECPQRAGHLTAARIKQKYSWKMSGPVFEKPSQASISKM